MGGTDRKVIKIRKTPYKNDFRNPFLEMKRKNLQRAFGIIKSESPMKVSRFLALCEFNMGVSRETAKRYMEVLRDMGSIEVGDGYVFIRKSTNDSS